MADLTDRQREFVAAFLGPARLNATEAARIAGYRWPNKQGPRLMTFREVAEAAETGFQEMLDGKRPSPGRGRWQGR